MGPGGGGGVDKKRKREEIDCCTTDCTAADGCRSSCRRFCSCCCCCTGLSDGSWIDSHHRHYCTASWATAPTSIVRWLAGHRLGTAEGRRSVDKIEIDDGVDSNYQQLAVDCSAGRRRSCSRKRSQSIRRLRPSSGEDEKSSPELLQWSCSRRRKRTRTLGGSTQSAAESGCCCRFDFVDKRITAAAAAVAAADRRKVHDWCTSDPPILSRRATALERFRGIDHRHFLLHHHHHCFDKPVDLFVLGRRSGP